MDGSMENLVVIIRTCALKRLTCQIIRKKRSTHQHVVVRAHMLAVLSAHTVSPPPISSLPQITFNHSFL